MIVGDFEKFGFGIIQQIEYIGTVFIGITDDLAGNADQFALNEFLENDTRMCFNIGSRNNRIGEPGDIIRAAGHFQFFAEPQLFHNGKHIDRLAFLCQGLHGLCKYAGGFPHKNIPA